MPEHAYSYKDTGLSDVLDTKDSFIQETLYRSAYGYTNPNTNKKWTPTQYWAKHVLKGTFYREDDEYDDVAWAALDDDEQPHTVMCNHRGDGKTARSIARITRGVCFRLVEFILYLQATLEKASMEMENVKTELIQNDFIREVFGVMKPVVFEEIKKTFGSRAFFLANPVHKSIPSHRQGEPFCFILPRGAEQYIRGMGVYMGGRRVRVQWPIADDLELDKLVINHDNRVNLKNWFFGSVMPLVPQDKFPDAVTGRWKKPEEADYSWQPPYRVQVNGTLLHHDSLIANLLSSTDWKSVKIPLGVAEKQSDGTVKYTSRRPSRISSEQLQAQAEVARKDRVLEQFYREKLCEPGSHENACWTRDLFQHMTLERDAELQTSPDVIRFVIVDPSKSASQQADLTGIIAVAVAPNMGRIYVRRAEAVHLNSNDIPDRALRICTETNSQMIFVETIGQKGHTDINFRNAISKRALPIQFFELGMGHTPKGDYGTGDDAIKRWRGQMILPYYQDKEVIHHPSMKDGIAEGHMLDYPNPADFCFIDCLGYIVAVMRDLGCHFGKQVKYQNITPFPQQINWEQMTRDIKEREWAAV